jgi:exosortase
MSEISALPALRGDDPKAEWPDRVYYGLSGRDWLRIGIIFTLLAAVFWPNLRRLWLKTNWLTGEANWGHSLLVPLIGLYYLYLNREALLSPPKQKRVVKWQQSLGVWLQLQAVAWGLLVAVFGYYSAILDGSRQYAVAAVVVFFAAATGFLLFRSGAKILPDRLAASSSQWFGGFVMIWGLWFYAWAIWPGQNDFFKDFAMVITLFGVVLLLCGWPVMRVAWFPILFLACAIPWPGLMYSRIALPLQQLAGAAAVSALQLTGVEAGRVGSNLIIREGAQIRVLNVAEACAGLKSLMTFITVGGAVAFLSARPLWQKLLISVFSVPIAIFCNMMRVAGQGMLDHYVSHKLSESFAHQFVGMMMIVPAFFLILMLGWILDNLFVEEMDKRSMGVGRRGMSTAKEKELVIEINRNDKSRVARKPTSPSPSGGNPPTAPTIPAQSSGMDLAEATRRLAPALPRERRPRNPAPATTVPPAADPFGANPAAEPPGPPALKNRETL